MEQRNILSPGPPRRELTPAEVKARFADQTRGRGVSAVSVAARGDDMLAGLAPPEKRAPAAVLVAMIEREHGLIVLLTQRTAHLHDHAGQIALPGGRIEPTDPDPVFAALREAQEEIGLPPGNVDVIGRLDTYITGTGFEITPIVGLVRAPFTPLLDEFEVAELFEVPLAFIIDPANHKRQSRELRGRMRSFFVLPYHDRYIWGATAAILVNLAEVLAA